MTKNVVFYARYSTDRQNEQSIETQIELGQKMIRANGWNLVEIFKDSGVSGTRLKTRPGIQALLKHIERNDIDIVLCFSVDRISRDMEHSAGILKTLRFHDIDLWTVTGAAPIKDMEVGIRSVLSHEQIEDGRIKTREGMKHTIRKGKAAGGLAYGYRVKLEYDSKGERIPGLREIEPFEAEIVRWIFEQYAKGQSPQAIAVNLNKQNTLGPRGLRWRDTAIRGHRSRGSGILNNEQYLGRLLWNRTTFRKNPVTEKRIARPNDPKDWEYGEAPHLRIIDDALWTKVKQQQIKNEKLFDKTHTNRLNKSHRPQYLLSGILECAHCHGPYAVMAKDRYGCTNRKKKLPIDSLGGIICTNSKTISRHELEERVLAAFPEGLFSINNIEHVRDTLSKELSKSGKQSAKHRDQLVVNIKKLEQQQRSLMEQLAQRASEGRPAIPAFNDMIDDQEDKLIKLRSELKATPATDTSKRLLENTWVLT